MIALTMILIACQQEVLDSDYIAQTTDGQVTIGVEVDDLPMTRSGEELAPNRFIMEVYSIDLDMVDEPIPFDQKPDSVYCAAKGSFNIDLAEGQHYTLLFWADYIEESPNNTPDNLYNAYNGYNISDLKDVRIEEPNMPVAFAGSVSFSYEAAAAVKPYLKNTITHSVGQVNFVQTKAISTQGNLLSLNLTKSYKLNVDGLSITELTYSAGCRVGFDAVEANSVILTTYLIAENKNSSIMDVEYQYNNNPTQTISNVPFQRNYRTFIRGDFSGIQGIGGEDIEIDVEENWNAGETPKPEYKGYKIGDPYPSDVRPYGVVYEVDSTGTAGKILSMDHTYCLWSEGFELTGANDKKSGLANMVTIAARDRRFNMHYSFWWAHQKNMQANIDPKEYAPGTKGVWYLPSIDEVVAIHELEDIHSLNTVLRAYGGTELSNELGSSTEIDATSVYTSIGGDDASRNKDYFYSDLRTRAVMAFDGNTVLPERPQPKYKVGDLYPNEAKPIGVVYAVNFDGVSGRILSLIEKNAETPFTRSEQEVIHTGSYSASNGIANTAAVMALDDYNSYNYPATAWVARLNTVEVDYETAKTGVWYVPTFYDLGLLNQVQASIMNVLNTTPGAKILDPDRYYLSSTQSLKSDGTVENSVYDVKFNYYNIGTSSSLSTEHLVRGVMEFDDDDEVVVLPRYKVGDVYEVDGEPIGIVYQLDDKEGYSGRMVSIDVLADRFPKWYYGGDNVVGHPDFTKVKTEAKNEVDGLYNMNVILNHPETVYDFPAFEFADRLNAERVVNKGDLDYYVTGSNLDKWYFPARKEIYAVADEYEEINAVLEKLGATKISLNRFLTTSTQYGDSHNWTYRPWNRAEMNDQDIYTGYRVESMGMDLEERAIRLFDARVSDGSVEIAQADENMMVDVIREFNGSYTRYITIVANHRGNYADVRDAIDRTVTAENPYGINAITIQTPYAGKIMLPENSSYMFSDWRPDVQGLYDYLSGVTSIIGLENLDASQVKNMDRMFYGCSDLTTLDLSGWDLSNVTSCTEVFGDCPKLKRSSVITTGATLSSAMQAAINALPAEE